MNGGTVSVGVETFVFNPNILNLLIEKKSAVKIRSYAIVMRGKPSKCATLLATSMIPAVMPEPMTRSIINRIKSFDAFDKIAG